mgnify:CR=1 FL=1
MWRGIIFFIKLAVLAGAAVWIANQPGHVSLQWLGYDVDTTPGILILLILAFAVALALLYHWWRGLLWAPRRVSRSVQRNRRERGYRALTRGLVSVAAGDAVEARREARKARELLQEPLTHLLSAQAAQLQGDEVTAKRHFEAMLEVPETRFLGLRGLMLQALRDGDETTARIYLMEAQKLKPSVPWVLNNLFDLSEKAGDLSLAEEALLEGLRQRALPRDETRRKRAVLLYEKAVALAGEDLPGAVAQLREAHNIAPDLPAIAALYARLLARQGRSRRAAKILQRSWSLRPHPDLAEAYADLDPTASPIGRLKQLERLVQDNPEHVESRLALADAALNAELWGEARRRLLSSPAEIPERRACLLLAELEERENGDSAAAAEWLRKADLAERDPMWLCRACGTPAAHWTPHCTACDAFDSLEWRAPPRVAVTVPARLEPETVTTTPEAAATVDTVPGVSAPAGTPAARTEPLRPGGGH